MQERDRPGDETSAAPKLPTGSAGAQLTRVGLQVLGGAIPGIGGMLSAAAGYWSEREQQKVNQVFEQWLKMLEQELREKAQTIIEIVALAKGTGLLKTARLTGLGTGTVQRLKRRAAFPQA